MNPEPSEKQRTVLNSLLKIFPASDYILSPPDLLRQLDARVAPQTFDRDLFNQLSEQLSSSGRKMTPENFASVWSQADTRLTLMRRELATEVTKQQATVDQFRKKRNEHSQTENLNQNGISSSAYLNVLIKSAENMVVGRDGSNMAFDLAVEGTNRRFGPSDNPQFFLIDETVKFPVADPNSAFTINAFDASGAPLMQESLPLREFMDQKQHPKAIRMFNMNNQAGAVVNTEIQFVHSLVKLYDALIPETEGVLVQKQRDLSDVDNYIRSLSAPFPELASGPSSVSIAPVVAVGAGASALAAGALTAAQPTASRASNALQAVKEKITSALPALDRNALGLQTGQPLLPGSASLPGLGPFPGYADHFSLGYFILSLLGGLLRSTLLDTFIALILFGFMRLGMPQLTRFAALVFAIVCGIGALLGFFWLAIYAKNFWTTGYTDNFLNLGTRRLAVFIEFILIACRAAAAYLFFNAQKQLPAEIPGFNFGQMGPMAGGPMLPGPAAPFIPTNPAQPAPFAGPAIGGPVGPSFSNPTFIGPADNFTQPLNPGANQAYPGSVVPGFISSNAGPMSTGSTDFGPNPALRSIINYN